MAATKNEPIGEIVCPAKGCERMVPVYRFKGRPNERMQRFANKLYCRCPRHGQFGGSVGDDEMQEYIEVHSRKCANESAGNEPAAEPVKTPETQRKLPAKTAVKKAPATPAVQSPAQPATTPAAPAQEKPKGFGFFT